MSEKRKTLEITLWVDAIRRANDSLRDQQRKYEAAQADYDRLSRQLDEFDEKSASLRAEAQQLVLAVEQANADIRAITEANAGSESEIAVLKNESEHSRFRIDEATSELERAGQGRESIEREAADHRAAIETLKSGMAGLDARVAELREALRALLRKRPLPAASAATSLTPPWPACRTPPPPPGSAPRRRSRQGRLRPTAWPRRSARPRS